MTLHEHVEHLRRMAAWTLMQASADGRELNVLFGDSDWMGQTVGRFLAHEIQVGNPVGASEPSPPPAAPRRTGAVHLRRQE